MAVEQSNYGPETDCGDHFCVGEAIKKRGLIATLNRLDNYCFYLQLRVGDFWHFVSRYIDNPNPKIQSSQIEFSQESVDVSPELVPKLV